MCGIQLTHGCNCIILIYLRSSQFGLRTDPNSLFRRSFPMKIARALAGCTLLATLVLLSSDGVLSQDKKDKPPAKIKGQLPPGWGDLGLSAAQKEDVYKINAEYKEKVDKLEDEIKKLRAEQVKKRLTVLNDDQRKKLRDAIGGEDPKDKSKDKDKN
jgi:hypothetical protein